MAESAEEIAASIDRLTRVRDGGNPIVIYGTAEKPATYSGPWGEWEKLAAAMQGVQSDKETLADAFLDRVMADAQCYVLNARQHRGDLHPYTCGNNSRHRPLIATPSGWRCADCDYRQDLPQ